MSEHNHHHIVPFKLLLRTFLTLLVLTVLTVVFSMVDFSALNQYLPRSMDLGPLNIVFAVGIASIKACLVLTFFMALVYDKQLNKGIVAMNFFFVTIFFVFVLSDTLFRSVADPMEGMKLPFNSPVISANENPVSHGEHGDAHDKKSESAVEPSDKNPAEEEFVEEKSEVVVEIDSAKVGATDSAVKSE